MGEIRYMISEAAKRVHVESHVLRYWEEELNLTISRTEMGHRYYTEDDIQLFCCIRKLKNEGMLLKDLKPLIPKLKETRDKLNSAQTDAAATEQEALKATSANQEAPDSAVIQSKENDSLSNSTLAEGILANCPSAEFSAETSESAQDTDEIKNDVKNTPVTISADSKSTALAPTEAEVIPITQLEQVRGLIGDVLNEVVTNNNAALEQSISSKVTKDVIREMDFLFQAKERQEEEHYRKLDCLIRQQQATRRELAEKDTAFGKLKKMLT